MTTAATATTAATTAAAATTTITTTRLEINMFGDGGNRGIVDQRFF